MLLSVSIDNNMSFNIDVCVMTRVYKLLVVINDYRHHLRGEGSGVFIKELHDSHVGRACNTAMAPQFQYVMNRKLQPDSDVLRIHILHVMDTYSTRYDTYS